MHESNFPLSLVKTKNNNIYYARDPHLHFTFSNRSSRQYNLFITNTNKGGGTKFVASPDNTVSFATPEYQNNTYYLGTTKKQKTFKHTVAANMLTKQEVNSILQWLKVGETGFLSYDTNPYWGWDVVVTSVGEVSQFEASDGLIIEFTVEFKTINDWHARSTYNATKAFGGHAEDGFKDKSRKGEISHTIANEYGIPEIIVKGNTIYLPQVSDEHSFVNVDWTIAGKVTDTSPQVEQTCTIKLNNKDIYSYIFTNDLTTPYTVNYMGQYGFSLILNCLAEDTDKLGKGSQGTTGLLILNNELPEDVTNSSTMDANWASLGEGAYKCEVFAITPTNTTEWPEGLFNENTNPAAGNEYTVRISLYGIDGANYTIGTISEGQQPIKVYIGKCNTLVLSNGTRGTITTIKHNSL